MVRRDILGRYRGSFGGAFWTIINPLLLMLTYFFVFGVVLRDRYDPKASWSSFALYFLAGMLPWLAFSEAAEMCIRDSVRSGAYRTYYERNYGNRTAGS